MCEVVMQTAEQFFTREVTEGLVKILNRTYSKSDLKQVADNATQLNAGEITQPLRLLEYLEGLFDGTLGYW